MKIIEFTAKVGKGGVVQIPKEELLATGLKEGDEICMSYIEQPEAQKISEFMFEKELSGDERNLQS